MVQLSHPYMTTRKTIVLTIRTFVGKVISLLYKTFSGFVIAFLLMGKQLLMSRQGQTEQNKTCCGHMDQGMKLTSHPPFAEGLCRTGNGIAEPALGSACIDTEQ